MPGYKSSCVAPSGQQCSDTHMDSMWVTALSAMRACSNYGCGTPVVKPDEVQDKEKFSIFFTQAH